MEVEGGVDAEVHLPQNEQQIQEDRCMYCREAYPVQNPEVRTTFLCGHSCHSYCFFSTPYLNLCGECQLNVYRYEYNRTDFEDTNSVMNDKKDTIELLETNDLFKEDLLKLRESVLLFRKSQQLYEKDLNTLMKEFNHDILPYIQTIKRIQKEKINKVALLESRKQMQKLSKTVSAKTTMLSKKYNIRAYNLHYLRNRKIQGKSLRFLAYSRNYFRFGRWRYRSFKRRERFWLHGF